MPADAAYLAELREAAQRALIAWPVEAAALELVSLSENTVFRVDSPDGTSYALRIHRPGYNTLPELESELIWIRALRESGINVPVPIPAADGRHYVPVALPGWDAERQVGMTQWLPTTTTLHDLLEKTQPATRDARFAELGAIIATLHNHATSWQTPSGFVRRVWDADGLVGSDPLWGRFWELPDLTAPQRDLLVRARRSIWQQLHDYGTQADTFTLIHADLHAHNLLVADDRLTVIDFDDAGFGWHQYDLAVALASHRQDPAFEEIRDALVQSYRSVRPISDEALALLPVLLLVRSMVTLGWIHGRPELDHGDRLAPMIAAICQQAERYLTGPFGSR